MASNRAHTLVLEIDVSRGVECLFQSISTYQGRTTVVLVLFAYRLGYINPGVGVI